MTVCAAALIAGCGTPQQLPVAITRCDALQTKAGYEVRGLIENRSTKPITAISVAVDFYHDFRYTRITASTKLEKVLDPGAQREISLGVWSGVQGQAMRCFATHIAYLDGTSQDVKPAQ